MTYEVYVNMRRMLNAIKTILQANKPIVYMGRWTSGY